MGLSWSKIANTFKKIGSVTGKVGQVAIVAEPFAAIALQLAGQNSAAATINAVYNIVNATEANLAAASGQTKLAVVQTAINSGVLPILAIGLGQAGKTIDLSRASTAVSSSINAVVAENNAQAALSELLNNATISGVPVNPAELQKAMAAVSAATAAVITAGGDIHNSISTSS